MKKLGINRALSGNDWSITIRGSLPMKADHAALMQSQANDLAKILFDNLPSGTLCRLIDELKRLQAAA